MSHKIIIINGPNLNLLGTREPEIYGNESLEDLKSIVNSHMKKNFPDMSVDFFQSNTEGEIVNKIQESASLNGIIINAGALTHTSIGILDALNMFKGPKIEIHITNVHARESFRHKSYISPVASGIIAGLGVNSYLLAIEALQNLIND